MPACASPTAQWVNEGWKMAFAEYNSAIQRSADKPQPKRDLDYDYEDDDEDEQIRAAGEDFGRY